MFNLLDTVTIFIFFLSAILASINGLVRELTNIGNFILSFIIAFFVVDWVAPLIEVQKKYATITYIVLWFLILAVLIIVLGVILGAFSNMLSKKVGGVNHLGGFILGAVRGILIMSIIVFGINAILPSSVVPNWILQSKFKNSLIQIGDEVSGAISYFLPERVAGTYNKLLQQTAELKNNSEKNAKNK